MTTLQNFHFPWHEDNHFEILIDSDEFFPRMLDAIKSAQQYVLLEQYLIESGAVANKFIDALLEAASRGVKVRLLFDDFGAIGLKQRERSRLEHPNIQIVYYNPLQSHNILVNIYRVLWRNMEHGLYRDHRKILTIDGKVAFTGGAGITDEFEPQQNPEMRWRETMVEIKGPVVRDWQQLFGESWARYAKEPLMIAYQEPDKINNGQLGRVTVNDIHYWGGVQRSLGNRIGNAEHRIWFATAYFVPPWRFRRKLKRAARAGVDVRLLLPGPITDHPGVRHASHRFYARLLNNGVRIFEYQPRFLHAKTVLCDNWVSVGSSNFDRWNLEWNLEANQEIEDQYIAEKVKRMFENDFASCVEYTYEKWHHRNWYSRVLEWFWKKVEKFSITIKNRSRR